MELDLQRTLLEGYQLTIDSVLSQEETMESIVPDAFPDVSRIVSTSGTACLTIKQLNSGSMKMMGTASVCVLYVPEEDSYPRALTIKVPFQCCGDDPKIKETDYLHATILSVTADARLINPRKLFIRAEVKLGVKVYTQYSSEIICDFASKDNSAIQRQWKKSKHYAISAVLEKTFLFSDTLRQSSSKPHIDELLTYSVSPKAVEARYIGKKLVCKGEMELFVLYCTGTELNTGRFELPFSQILELESSFEEGDPDVSVYLKNTECFLREGELEVTVEAALQASLWASRDVTLLCDAYSTAAALEVERTVSVLCTSFEKETHKEATRKFCESGIPAKQVLNCAISLSPIVAQQAERVMECSTDGRVCILYLSEDNALCAVEYSIPVKSNVDSSDGAFCRCCCRPVGEVIAVPVSGGFEVRFETEFFWQRTKYDSIPQVTSAKENTAAEKMGTNPSVIIRMVGAGESLWDIAKSCSSTIADICLANDITSDAVSVGTVLLIPTKR